MMQVLFALLAAAALAYYSLSATPRFDPASMINKRVIVTGASQGIGRDLAYELAKMQAHVVLIARSKDKLDAIAAKCLEYGAKSANVYSADLSSHNEETFKLAIDKSIELLGGELDMLILNHVSTTGLVHDDWQQAFNMGWLVDQFYLNTFSYFALSHYALPALIKSKGNLVAVSSATGILTLPKVVGYSSQKHALHGYFNSLRSNLLINGHHDTSITLAVLGAINTESFQANTGDTVQVAAESPQETARAIIASGKTRQRTLYFPYSKLRPAHILSVLFPELFDWIGRMAM